MLIGFNNIIQIYNSWGCGLFVLFIIFIINMNDSLPSINNTYNKAEILFKFNFRWLMLIILGLFISISVIRSQVDSLVITGQGLLQLSKINTFATWLAGLFIVSLVKLNFNSKFKNNKQTVNVIFTLCYLWQVMCCITHPILLLVCLEINLLLFIIIILNNTQITEGLITNIIILLWTGALASIFAFLALRVLSASDFTSPLNLFWFGVFLLKFILIPAQVTLFGIYQRWSTIQFVMYIVTYYIPLLCFIIPLLVFAVNIPNILALAISGVLTFSLIGIVAQFETTSNPNRTIALSSLITLVIITISALVIN